MGNASSDGNISPKNMEGFNFILHFCVVHAGRDVTMPALGVTALLTISLLLPSFVLSSNLVKGELSMKNMHNIQQANHSKSE